MPLGPDERQTGLQVFTQGEEPTFSELAAEAILLARLGITERPPIVRKVRYWLAAWTLRRVHRWGSAAEWSLPKVWWRIGVCRYGFVPFWILSVGLLVQAIRGRFANPVDLLLTLLVFLCIAAYFGLLLAAGWRAALRASVDWAQVYRRKRLELERQLMSPEGYGGWRSIKKPDGSWMLVRQESGESAA